MLKIRTSWIPLAAALAIVGCGDQDSQPGEASPPAQASAPAGEPASVWFIEPRDGSTVPGPDVNVVLGVSGLRVVEAGVFEEGTGHHHIFLNADLTPMDAVIPVGVPGIIHMGLGQTEWLLEGVEPGEHRLIAVVADGAHIPLAPPVVDTIFFTVVPPAAPGGVGNPGVSRVIRSSSLPEELPGSR
jgi:hypothetical protein